MSSHGVADGQHVNVQNGFEMPCKVREPFSALWSGALDVLHLRDVNLALRVPCLCDYF